MIGGVERGERNPTLRVIVRLAEGLEIEVSRLMRQAEAEVGPTTSAPAPHSPALVLVGSRHLGEGN